MYWKEKINKKETSYVSKYSHICSHKFLSKRERLSAALVSLHAEDYETTMIPPGNIFVYI